MLHSTTLLQPMIKQNITGVLRKMRTELDTPVRYRLPLGDQVVEMNPLIGKTISLTYSGNISCVNCGRATKKSFNQGYCFPCFRSLAECDMCIMRPETCHFHLGTCRDEAWAEKHCMQAHYVYIANSSGLKVGITRGNQLPTRWIDQGARQAVAVFKVRNRFHSGLLEEAIKNHVSDRTDWRKMLKGGAEVVDLNAEASRLIEQAQPDLDRLQNTDVETGRSALEYEVLDREVVEIEYPVTVYPEKVKSFNFDKTPNVSGVLDGIKGQYLILDSGVINMRKFAGYEVCLEA